MLYWSKKGKLYQSSKKWLDWWVMLWLEGIFGCQIHAETWTPLSPQMFTYLNTPPPLMYVEFRVDMRTFFNCHVYESGCMEYFSFLCGREVEKRWALGRSESSFLLLWLLTYVQQKYPELEQACSRTGLGSLAKKPGEISFYQQRKDAMRRQASSTP